MSSSREALSCQLSSYFTHCIIYCPCLVHLIVQVLETLSVATHSDRLAEPLIEYSSWLFVYEVKHPARVIERSGAMHVLVDVP